MNKGKSIIQRHRNTAEYFVEHGLVGVEGFKIAMAETGYGKKSVYETAHHKFKDPKMIQTIADMREKREYTREKARALLEKLREDCITANDRTNRLGVIKELDKIHQLYGDEDTSITITQVIVSPQERRAVLAKEMQLIDDINDAQLAIAE